MGDSAILLHRDGPIHYNTPIMMPIPLGLISWFLMGLAAALLARWQLPSAVPMGLGAALLFGVSGALVGGLLATLLGFGGLAGYDFRSLSAAALCSVLFLLLRAGNRPA